MRGMRVTGTPLASGPVTSLPVGKLYVYGGSKPLKDDPGIVKASGPGGEAKAAARLARLDRFADALAALGCTDPGHARDDLTIKAGRQVGVGEKTAKGYRLALRRRAERQEAQAS